MLIRGGTVFDGSGSPAREEDVGIKGGQIVFLGSAGNITALEQIEARGLYVCPGFIDVHSHSDFSLLADPLAASGKLFQGVTTEVNGNCGLSGGPILGAVKAQREEDFKELGIRERWEGLADYLTLMERTRPAMNFSTLVGHGNIRASVVGYSDKAPSEEELGMMCSLLEDALDAGAIGLSSGLIYPPGAYSNTEELCRLALRGGKRAKNFIYATHMRSEGDRLIEAIDEAIKIGRCAGRAEISHIKTAGKRNWHKIDEAIGLIENARSGGLAITADRYSYTASSTDLDTILPAWAYEGGIEAELKRLKDPSVSQKIKSGINKEPVYWGSVYVSGTSCAEDKWMEGRSLEEIAARLEKPPVDALFHVLIRGEARVGAIFHSMSEENLRRFYRLPWVMVGSDSTARDFEGITASGKPHPRAFGTFPRYIKRYTIEERLVSMEEAIRKTTHLPAAVFGLRGRGLIREGWQADIAVFDPRSIGDRATFQEPYRRAEGIVHLLVNGTAVIKDSLLTGKRSGKVLRHGG